MPECELVVVPIHFRPQADSRVLALRPTTKPLYEDWRVFESMAAMAEFLHNRRIEMSDIATVVGKLAEGRGATILVPLHEDELHAEMPCPQVA